MNTGQMLLTIGALVLLGATILSVNRSTIQNDVILNQTEVGVYAVSLATSYIQRASGMDFDEKTVDSIIIGSPPVPTTTNLTPAASLGRDGAGEIANVDTTFDDFDDYNQFAKKDTVRYVDTFTTLDTVYYIQAAAPDVGVTGPTFFKRMDIRVFGSVGRGVFTDTGANAQNKGVDTIKLSYIFSYFR